MQTYINYAATELWQTIYEIVILANMLNIQKGKIVI